MAFDPKNTQYDEQKELNTEDPANLEFIDPLRETQTTSSALVQAIEQAEQAIDNSVDPSIRHSMAIRAVIARIKDGQDGLYDSFNDADKLTLKLYLSPQELQGLPI